MTGFDEFINNFNDFLKGVIWILYRLPLSMMPVFFLCTVLIWGAVESKASDINEKRWRRMNILLTVISASAILYVTLLNRTPSEDRLVLMPFHGLIEARERKEMYRSMTMNILLFVPLGLFIPPALPANGFFGKTKRRLLITLAVSFLFSVSIEVIQLVFSLGRCETDDVICNLLGAFIGSLSFAFSSALKKRKNDIRKKKDAENSPDAEE